MGMRTPTAITVNSRLAEPRSEYRTPTALTKRARPGENYPQSGGADEFLVDEFVETELAELATEARLFDSPER